MDKVFYYTNPTLALSRCDFEGLGLDVVTEWLNNDIVGCLQQFFMDCQTGNFLKDPELVVVESCVTWCFLECAKYALCACVQIRKFWEILSGQHRTNAGDEFVNEVKAKEIEWAAVLGKTLCPIFYHKMPQRLAKRLSAGFQIKESQPQVLC